eukprot:gnl/Dysnectes_brevis/1437_a1628_2179.p1 GENE.gnl/Dysnectes_brevis/1437_a1628_2179~~gnl/Dysnectes_brevis/1437_a1628_2179.p1  ORF type:complete len:643 (+),score=221.60 gnl/Dysnectes_brevis/1437_a1628_2179:204-2132(+)
MSSSRHGIPKSISTRPLISISESVHEGTVLPLLSSRSHTITHERDRDGTHITDEPPKDSPPESVLDDPILTQLELDPLTIARGPPSPKGDLLPGEPCVINTILTKPESSIHSFEDMRSPLLHTHRAAALVACFSCGMLTCTITILILALVLVSLRQVDGVLPAAWTVIAAPRVGGRSVTVFDASESSKPEADLYFIDDMTSLPPAAWTPIDPVTLSLSLASRSPLQIQLSGAFTVTAEGQGEVQWSVGDQDYCSDPLDIDGTCQDYGHTADSDYCTLLLYSADPAALTVTVTPSAPPQAPLTEWALLDRVPGYVVVDTTGLDATDGLLTVSFGSQTIRNFLPVIAIVALAVSISIPYFFSKTIASRLFPVARHDKQQEVNTLVEGIQLGRFVQIRNPLAIPPSSLRVHATGKSFGPVSLHVGYLLGEGTVDVHIIRPSPLSSEPHTEGRGYKPVLAPYLVLSTLQPLPGMPRIHGFFLTDRAAVVVVEHISSDHRKPSLEQLLHTFADVADGLSVLASYEVPIVPCQLSRRHVGRGKFRGLPLLSEPGELMRRLPAITVRQDSPPEFLRGEITPASIPFMLGAAILEAILGEPATLVGRPSTPLLALPTALRDVLNALISTNPADRPQLSDVGALLRQCAPI